MVIRKPSAHPVPAIYDVCAIGNAIVDVIADCDEAFLETMGVAKGSMTLVDETRADFLYKNFGPAVEVSGGSVANTAAGVAGLGGRPAYIGRIKADQLGEIFSHDMNASGVHFSTPPRVDGPSTGRCLILVTPDAQRSMSTCLGIAADLSSDDIDPHIVANAQVTFLEGYLFDKPKAQAAFYTAAHIAQEAGRQIALTLSDTFCVDRHRQAFQAFIRDHVDILIANEFELMSLYELPTLEEALAAARTECRIAVGTRSEKGAVIVSGGQDYVIPASPASKVVDTTGAGDLFAAGFLFGLTHGQDLSLSGALGAIAAAEVVSHYGPRPQQNLKELIAKKGIRI